jgi:beta-exotoxin I transport system ATP-binding protein
MSERPVIEAAGLTKSYGKRRGVEDLNLEVDRGEVIGFLGPNGAGKTTTIRTMLDLIRPTRGTVRIFGLDSRKGSVEIRRRTGYLPGELNLYPTMTGRELLTYMGNLRGGLDLGRIEDLAGRLSSDLDTRIGHLSHGNRQKIGLVNAFMHTPELLVLDEPTLGLDPLVQSEFHRMVIETRERGATVFLSSHVLPEVEAVCDRVAMVRDGRLFAVEHVEALKERVPHRLEIRFAHPVPPVAFTDLPGVKEVAVEGRVVRCSLVGSPDAIVKAASRFTVVDLVSREPSLEEIFLEIYGDRGEHRAA